LRPVAGRGDCGRVLGRGKTLVKLRRRRPHPGRGGRREGDRDL